MKEGTGNDMSDTRPIRPGKMSLSRQKACEGCIKSKRRCDMQVPHCGRCHSRGVSCVYSADSSNPMLAPSRSSSSSSTSSLPAPLDPDMRWLDSLVLNPQQLAQQTPLRIAEEEWLNAIITPNTYLQGLPTPDDSESNRTTPDAVPSRELIQLDKYVRIEKRSLSDDSSLTKAEVDFMWKILESMLKTFTATLQTLFIHPRLYSQSDKPLAITNLFSMCAAYQAKSPQNEDAIFRMLNAEVERLFSSYSEDIHDIHINLPLVQALLLYQIIRLFDGNIRQRALGERQQAKLLAWSEKLFQAIESSDKAVLSTMKLSEWDSWVFWECVKRTVFFVALMDGYYNYLRDNVCGCSAHIMLLTLSLNRHLWAASTQNDWRQNLNQTGKLDFCMHFDSNSDVTSVSAPANINEIGILFDSCVHGLVHAQEVFGSRVYAMIQA